MCAYTQSPAGAMPPVLHPVPPPQPADPGDRPPLAGQIDPLLELHRAQVSAFRRDDHLPRPPHAWIVGPQGCGKSHEVHQAVVKSGLPWVRVDLARFALSGQPGLHLDLLLQQLADQSPVRLGDPAVGVVIVEGLDRELAGGPGGERARSLQAELASLLDGRSLPCQRDGRLRHVSSRRLLFLMVFSEAVSSPQPLGFRPAAGPASGPSPADRLVRAGVQAQLLHLSASRIDAPALTPEDLEALVLRPEGCLAQLHQVFAAQGARLEVTPGAARLLVEAARPRGPGAHGLNQAVAALGPQLLAALAGLPPEANGVLLTAAFLDGRRTSPEYLQGGRLPLPEPEPAAAHEVPAHPDFPELPHRPSRPLHTGAASQGRLANQEDLRPWTQPRAKPAKWRSTVLRGFIPLVEATPDGSTLTALSARDLLIPADERRRATLIVGANGGGKSTRLMLPLIFADIDDPQRSVIVLDAQLALTNAVADYARRVRGRRARILYFNPMDPGHSIRWNPIEGLKDRPGAFDVASSLAAGIPLGASETSYFRLQGTRHVASLIRVANRMGKGTLGEVQSIIEAGGERISEVGRLCDFPELVSFGRDMLHSSNHATTACEMINMLGAWYDDRVCQVTARSELSFEELEKEPTILIVALPEESVSRLRPLTNCLMHRLFEFVMRRGQEHGGSLRRPLALHIDEFGSAVGAIPDFHRRANTLRKRGLMITAAVQTLSQIHETYPETGKSLLAAFNTQIFVPRLAAEDAQYVSNLSGLTTALSTVTGPHGETQSSSPQTRPVLLPTEVDRPPLHAKHGPRMTFLFPDTPAFQGYLPAIWENPDLAKIVALDRRFRPPAPRRPLPQGSAQAASVPVPPTPGGPAPDPEEMAKWTEEYA